MKSNRRAFIRSSCLACMGFMATGTILEACSASTFPLVKAKNYAENQLHVPISSFNDEKVNAVIVRNTQLESDILLVRKMGEFKALYLQCTHEGVNLSPSSTKIHCNAHGSVFDFDGNVLKEPALKPLRQFRTEKNLSEIIIYLS